MEKQYMEIMGRQDDVSYEIPAVLFPSYEEYKKKALEIAAYISGKEITEENVKEIKSTLADARKLTDRLDRARIDMRKAILQNYAVFEGQIKEISGIVDAADKELRGKLRELEEAERERKKQVIRELWDKRICQAPFIEKLMPGAFDRWLTPKHLNKTTPMKTVEADMTAWIQKTDTEMGTAQSMGNDYLEAYVFCGNLAEAIRMVNDHRKNLAEIEALGKEALEEDQTQTFIVYGAKDIALAERLLAENNIEFTKI